MALTSIATNTTGAKRLYLEKLFRDVGKNSFFSYFMGSSADSLVQEVTDLSKSKGDRLTTGLVPRLVGAGVSGDTVLENNEEALSPIYFELVLNKFRHAVSVGSEMTRKRAFFDLPSEAEAVIKQWGSEKIDQLCFDAAGIGSGATADPTRIFYKNSSGTHLNTGTAATAKGALDATNSKLTLDFISYIKREAKTGRDRAQTPLRPIKYKGQDNFGLLVHPKAMYDLKISSDWKQAQRDAQTRGDNNPLFTGAIGQWDGVYIFEHENCAIATDGGGAAVPWAKCAFFGAQSLVWGWGRRPDIIEDERDYKDKIYYAYDMICAVGRPQFNSQDYGMFGVWLATSA